MMLLAELFCFGRDPTNASARSLEPAPGLLVSRQARTII